MGRIGSGKGDHDKYISRRQLNYEHIGLENLTNRKIFHKNRRFSTAC
jgi:hypothetical protein